MWMPLAVSSGTPLRIQCEEVKNQKGMCKKQGLIATQWSSRKLSSSCPALGGRYPGPAGYNREAQSSVVSGSGVAVMGQRRLPAACPVAVWGPFMLLQDSVLFKTHRASKTMLDLKGELLSPCRCDGSVKCTHQPCLIKWISERGCWSCELCYYKYHVIAISTKNPLQWQAISLTVIEKVQIAAAILGSLFLIASISWLIWSTFSPSAKWQRQDLLFQICYGMYGFMDVVCIGLIIHEGPSVYRIFKRWQAVNQQWKVLNYDKTKDIEDQKAGGRTNPRTSSSTQADAASSQEEAVGNPAQGDGGGGGGGGGGGNRAPSHPSGPLADHHCAYTILHILSHLRPHEQRSSAGGNRELVMRVTTV
ncbi:E3 ubiquitin-protein ligase MARCHF4 [Gracilinanus agilis]|uniref:E3 ubiquitin-protein ligase MARCHF4 n=1 Tax=Gracilinanus agilis TaxID=191870 RepID=UPI001CFE88A8|nr:E3 ubiquitin-protein ligase MARCHF4 [Gracilinanus agilis]